MKMDSNNHTEKPNSDDDPLYHSITGKNNYEISKYNRAKIITTISIIFAMIISTCSIRCEKNWHCQPNTILTIKNSYPYKNIVKNPLRWIIETKNGTGLLIFDVDGRLIGSCAFDMAAKDQIESFTLAYNAFPQKNLTDPVLAPLQTIRFWCEKTDNNIDFLTGQYVEKEIKHLDNANIRHEENSQQPYEPGDYYYWEHSNENRNLDNTIIKIFKTRAYAWWMNGLSIFNNIDENNKVELRLTGSKSKKTKYELYGAGYSPIPAGIRSVERDVFTGKVEAFYAKNKIYSYNIRNDEIEDYCWVLFGGRGIAIVECNNVKIEIKIFLS